MTLKVAHIVPSFYPAFAYGGPTESVYQLSRALVRQGVDLRVLTTDANGPTRTLNVDTDHEVKMAEGFSVRYCHRQWPESMSAGFLQDLSSYIRWADVVHLEAVYSFPTIPTLLAAQVLDKPVFWSARGALARWKRARRQGLKAIYDRLCRMVGGNRVLFHFTSEPEMRESLKRFPGRRGVVIPNGVQYPENPTHPDRGETLRFLYLGRLDPIKGIENLLQACARLKGPSTGRWQLTIAGAGDPRYTVTLKKLIVELGLSDTVHVIGQVDGQDKEKCFAEADVVVVPSHLENFCIVVAEALARGIPVIASRGAPWPALEEKGCGLWVDNAPESLADAMERIGKMPLRPMGEKGRAWMQAEFSWDTLAARTVAVYQNMLRGES